MVRDLLLDSSKIELRGILFGDYKLIKKFRCGNSSMEGFLHNEAFECHILRSASTSLVLYDGELAGYFTLRRRDIQVGQTTLDIQTRDALDLERLAIAEKYQDKGLGTYIINHIITVAYQVNERYISTDALFEKWEWYQKRGFEPAIEDETNVETTEGFVYMIMDLYDEKFVDEYCCNP